MKNVLIISSSPRKKGNTNALCEQFQKGAEAKGHHVDLVRIMEKKIGFCLACDSCMKNGGKCIQKDDMAAILDLYSKADVLVLATPVYFYGISAQLKTFIDRYPYSDIIHICESATQAANIAENWNQAYKNNNTFMNTFMY